MTTYYSHDEENFPYESLQDLIDHHSLNVGDNYWTGEGELLDANDFLSADRILEEADDNFLSEAWEGADEIFTVVSDEAKAELSEFLKSWVSKHV
ncbi:MAG: hypothetical protein KGM99_15380, partial [Burkholderiales bacterium]|nr:hypothetical protein [Burkholderiales bacterium]